MDTYFEANLFATSVASSIIAVCSVLPAVTNRLTNASSDSIRPAYNVLY
jgi:hypothetical protein